MTVALRDRPVQRTIHPARRVAGAALAAFGATTAVIAVLTGATLLLAGMVAAVAGFAVSHRWTKVPTADTRLASERDASADYAGRPAA